MKYAFTAAALAASMAVMAPGAPATAQTYTWNSATFWSGAPADAWQRLDFLQQRITNGRRDGSLTAQEARRAERQLSTLRRQANRLRWRDGGHMNSRDSSWLQARLDTVSRNIRWARHNGVGYGDNGVAARYATNYDASRYYRAGRYPERRLSANDMVYRGSDGRYYCKRNDGTTGLIVGAAAGGLLGNLIDGGHNRVAGTLIGGALGALTGRAIDRNSDIRCR